jgi:hypothetical protein
MPIFADFTHKIKSNYFLSTFDTPNALNKLDLSNQSR